jgi:alcohol dehydrogenase
MTEQQVPPLSSPSGEARRRHRPRGRVRAAPVMLSPVAVMAGRVALERDASQRLRRLREAAADRLRERLRPSRPRMRALVAGPGGRLAWRSIPAPSAPGPQGAVVHPIAVATCDLDRALVLGKTPFVRPLCLGHECIAEVLAVGGQVSKVRPGQRVVVPFQINCGTCTACTIGRTGNCTSVPPISMYGFGVGGGHWGGALSDQLAVPFADAMLVALPDGVDPVNAASVADNVADGYRHIAPHLPELLQRDPDAQVRIVVSPDKRSPYSASVALYTGLVALALGARRVELIDARPSVRAHAERLGLDALTPAEGRRHRPAPLVVDAGASARSLRAALSATDRDGICTSAGMLHRSARVPVALMYGRNATLQIGRTHARAVIPGVLKLMADGRLHPEHVTTNVADLDDAPRALSEHVRSNATKTILAHRHSRAQ